MKLIFAITDDNTLNTCDIQLNLQMVKLDGASEKAINWFNYNGIKLNVSKCQLLICGHKFEHIICNVGDAQIINTILNC